MLQGVPGENGTKGEKGIAGRQGSPGDDVRCYIQLPFLLTCDSSTLHYIGTLFAVCLRLCRAIREIWVKRVKMGLEEDLDCQEKEYVFSDIHGWKLNWRKWDIS